MKIAEEYIGQGKDPDWKKNFSCMERDDKKRKN